MALVLEETHVKIEPGITKTTIPETSGLYPLEFQELICLTEVFEEYQQITGWENNKKYTVTDVQGNKLFSATETNTNWTNKIIAKGRRSFDVSVVNASNQEVMKFVRRFKFHGLSLNIAGFDYRKEKVLIMDPQGTTIGSAHQVDKSPISPPNFVTRNERGEDMIVMKSPVNPFLTLADYLFQMEWVGGTQQPVGNVQRIYPSNYLQFMLRTPRKFEIRFPRDLDVQLKACILGAVVLADFMFFE